MVERKNDVNNQFQDSKRTQNEVLNDLEEQGSSFSFGDVGSMRYGKYLVGINQSRDSIVRHKAFMGHKFN